MTAFLLLSPALLLLIFTASYIYPHYPTITPIILLLYTHAPMGNKQTKPQPQQQSPTSTISIPEIKHPKLKSAKLVASSVEGQPEYLEITKSIPTREIYEKWKKGIAGYAVGDNEIETILLPRLLEFEERGICGTSGLLKSHYVVLPFVLSEEIENRQAIRQPFLEKELWYLLYVLCSAGATAHNRGLVLGDVRPENILMSSDGEICVCCQQSFLDEQKNYYKTLTTRQKTYLSPQQIQSLAEQRNSPNSSDQQSQDFSIGLTLLSAILLHSQYQLYHNDTFNHELLRKEIEAMKNGTSYGDLLKKIVERLLRVDVGERLRCTEVVGMLRSYEESIVNLEDFQVDISGADEGVRNKLMGRSSQVSARTQKSGDLHKVINSNDLNKNSRIKYALSPRNSGINQQSMFVSYPAQNYATHQPNRPPPPVMAQLPFQREITANNSNYFVSGASYKARELPPVLVQSIYQQQRPNPLVYHQQGFPNLPAFQRAPLSESIPIGPQPVINKPQRLQVPNQPAQGSSFLTSPDVINYNSKIDSYISPIQHGARVTSQDTYGQFYRQLQPHPQSSQSQPQPQFQPQLQTQLQTQSQPQPQPQPLQQKPLNLSALTSSINSTIEQNEKKFNSRQFPRTKLTGSTRESTSIQPPEEKQKQRQRDKVFETYEQAMKNIDQRLRESKKQFPDDL